MSFKTNKQKRIVIYLKFKKCIVDLISHRSYPLTDVYSVTQWLSKLEDNQKVFSDVLSK